MLHDDFPDVDAQRVNVENSPCLNHLEKINVRRKGDGDAKIHGILESIRVHHVLSHLHKQSNVPTAKARLDGGWPVSMCHSISNGSTKFNMSFGIFSQLLDYSFPPCNLFV